jgi:predicted AAA+ superfamily ATPase
VKADRDTFGALVESFVFSEVLKLITASDLRLTPHHLRDRDMREADIVLERDDGMIAGIEVKASATVKASDFADLRRPGRSGNQDSGWERGTMLSRGAGWRPKALSSPWSGKT